MAKNKLLTPLSILLIFCCFLAVHNLSAQSIVAENIVVPNTFELSRDNPILYRLTNRGNAVSPSSVRSFIYLSKDARISADDLVVSSREINALLVNSFIDISRPIKIPQNWTDTTAYLIFNAYKTPQNYDTTVQPIRINIPRPPACAKNLGTGDIVCYDKTRSTDGTSTVYFKENDSIVAKKLDINGAIISSNRIGLYAKDSVLINNNLITKKLANGTVVFSRPIPPSVLSRAPSITHAIELGDGSFVFAGFQTESSNINIPYAKDSLIFVMTDSNLIYQSHFITNKKSVIGFTWYVTNDQIIKLLKLDNNHFIVIRSDGYDFRYIFYDKYKKVDTSLALVQQYYSGGAYGLGNAVQTNICRNSLQTNYYASASGNRYSQSAFFNQVFDLDSLKVSISKAVGEQSSYGDYLYYSYNIYPFSLNEQKLSVNYSDTRFEVSDFKYLRVYLYATNGSVKSNIYPFIQFDHVIQTTDTSCLFLVKQNGQNWVYNPACAPLILPDLTLTNLKLDTNKVNQGEILTYKVDISNIGTAAAPNNFVVKAYISTDSILSYDDIQDGIIPTGGYAAGFSVRNVLGASTIQENFVPGRYYLILKIDPADSLTELSESNNIVVSLPFEVIKVVQPLRDLAISLSATSTVIRRYSPLSMTVNLKNNSNLPFNNVVVQFAYPGQTVSGGIATPSNGTWQEWCAGGELCYKWSIPRVEAFATASLTVPLYVLNPASPVYATARLISSTPNDNYSDNNTVFLTLTPTFGAAQPKKLSDVSDAALTIFPSITEGSIFVNFQSSTNEDVQFNIYNLNGTLMTSENRNAQKGINQYPFDVKNLPNGVYFIQSIGNLGRGVATKFVKM